jgi:copper(I)-binding protein
MGSSPMMEMRPVDRIVIPHGQTVMLQPGGYHVMLMDLAAPLEASSQIRVTLTFEHAGQIAVTADVRDTAP